MLVAERAKKNNAPRALLQSLVRLLQPWVKLPPFFQRSSQDSSFGRDCFVLFTPAQQFFRVSGQFPGEVLKSWACMMLWVPTDLG